MPWLGTIRLYLCHRKRKDICRIKTYSHEEHRVQSWQSFLDDLIWVFSFSSPRHDGRHGPRVRLRLPSVLIPPVILSASPPVILSASEESHVIPGSDRGSLAGSRWPIRSAMTRTAGRPWHAQQVGHDTHSRSAMTKCGYRCRLMYLYLRKRSKMLVVVQWFVPLPAIGVAY